MKRFRDAFIASLLAAFAGWLVGIVCSAVACACLAIFQPDYYSREDWLMVLIVAVFSIPILLPTWLLVLLPYAWLAPPGSFLWKGRVLAGIGLLAGPLIVVIYSFYDFKTYRAHGLPATDWGPFLYHDLRNWGVISALVGASAGFVESWVQRRLGNSAT